LVRGEIRVMPPAGEEHGIVAHDFSWHLSNYVREHRLGRLVAAETGFRLGANTVRAADVAFISNERWALGESTAQRGFSTRVPDLVVEVVSPGDRAGEIQEKVREWFTYGVRLAWFVYPSTQTVHVYSSPTQVQILEASNALDGGEVLPGFSCEVAALFDVD